MSSLAQFLLTQLAADEAAALAAGPWNSSGPRGLGLGDVVSTFDETAGGLAHIVRHDPARVLANVAALRTVIAAHEPSDEHPDYGSVRGVSPTCAACVAYHADMDCAHEVYPCATLRALAQPFAGRDGWQEPWTL